MALDTTIIEANNLLATGPTATNTAVPSKVTQLAGQNVWEYEFTNTWPQVGVWTVTLNTDGFSIPKSTVLGSFSVTQGTVYKMAVNWETTESVETIATRVDALEADAATLTASVTAVENTATAIDARVIVLENGATALTTGMTAVQNTAIALVNRVDALETAQVNTDTAIAEHTAQITALMPRVDTVQTAQTAADATIATLITRIDDLEAQVAVLVNP